jgi:hypothetical protein
MKGFLFWFSGFLPLREIKEENTPYLERFYLFTVLGWRFYLHHFVGSDPARGLHCHPWRLAFSIILSGWYWEETSYGTRKVKWFNWLTGDSKHRVVLPVSVWRKGSMRLDKPETCWTLFAHNVNESGKKDKDWGFYTDLKMPDYPGAMAFHPYRYEKEGDQKDWWLTAKTRRKLEAEKRSA